MLIHMSAIDFLNQYSMTSLPKVVTPRPANSRLVVREPARRVGRVVAVAAAVAFMMMRKLTRATALRIVRLNKVCLDHMSATAEYR